MGTYDTVIFDDEEVQTKAFGRLLRTFYPGDTVSLIITSMAVPGPRFLPSGPLREETPVPARDFAVLGVLYDSTTMSTGDGAPDETGLAPLELVPVWIVVREGRICGLEHDAPHDLPLFDLFARPWRPGSRWTLRR